MSNKPKKSSKGKAKSKGRKLQLNKETVKDLSVSQDAMNKIKGGVKICTGNASGC